MNRLAVVAAIAMLGFVLPSSGLAAAPFGYSVQASYCYYDGGVSGYGYMVFNTKVKEHGVSGANYFRTRTKLRGMRQGYAFTFSDTGWTTSSRFPNDADSYYRVSRAKYQYDRYSLGYDHQFVTRLQVWSTTRGLLSEVVLRSEWC